MFPSVIVNLNSYSSFRQVSQLIACDTQDNSQVANDCHVCSQFLVAIVELLVAYLNYRKVTIENRRWRKGMHLEALIACKYGSHLCGLLLFGITHKPKQLGSFFSAYQLVLVCYTVLSFVMNHNKQLRGLKVLL